MSLQDEYMEQGRIARDMKLATERDRQAKLAALGARVLTELDAIDVEAEECGRAGAAERCAEAIGNLRDARRELGFAPRPPARGEDMS